MNDADLASHFKWTKHDIAHDLVDPNDRRSEYVLRTTKIQWDLAYSCTPSHWLCDPNENIPHLAIHNTVPLFQLNSGSSRSIHGLPWTNVWNVAQP